MNGRVSVCTVIRSIAYVTYIDIGVYTYIGTHYTRITRALYFLMFVINET